MNYIKTLYYRRKLIKSIFMLSKQRKLKWKETVIENYFTTYCSNINCTMGLSSCIYLSVNKNDKSIWYSQYPATFLTYKLWSLIKKINTLQPIEYNELSQQDIDNINEILNKL